jgi:hypothetical protein
MALVPWCESCDRFLSPSTVAVDGTCPTCGAPVEAGKAHGEVDHVDDVDEDSPALPWHLWLLLAALAIYLGYRAFQGLEWVFNF